MTRKVIFRTPEAVPRVRASIRLPHRQGEAKVKKMNKSHLVGGAFADDDDMTEPEKEGGLRFSQGGPLDVLLHCVDLSGRKTILFLLLVVFALITSSVLAAVSILEVVDASFASWS